MKNLFTVRMFDKKDNYIAHREHIEGVDGIKAFKKEVHEKFPNRRVGYCRIYNETTQNTRYEGRR